MGAAIKGPALFLAQFADDDTPFNGLSGIVTWAAGLGYKGVQIPSWDRRLFDLELCAESATYADEVRGTCADAGVQITELSTHLQGQLIAVHSAYDDAFDGFAPEALRGKAAARQEWAVDQVTKAATAARRLGLTGTVSFTGSLAFPYLYPWPQRPAGLIETAFAELARRWRPILDAYDDQGVDIGFELHPGEDVFDGASWERFLSAVSEHPRARINYDPSHLLLQAMDYLGFIDLYHDRISAFHVKDAEFRPDGRQGVYSGYSPWSNRAGRFRSLGDGQVDFRSVFSRLTHHGYRGWAVMEWECFLKSPTQGAAEGAPFIARHLIEATDKAFDDFAAGQVDQAKLQRMLGVPECA
jgi:sugar phosphate isomerase/epimerase